MKTDATSYIRLMYNIKGKVMNRGMEGTPTTNRATGNTMEGMIR